MPALPLARGDASANSGVAAASVAPRFEMPILMQRMQHESERESVNLHSALAGTGHGRLRRVRRRCKLPLRSGRRRQQPQPCVAFERTRAALDPIAPATRRDLPGVRPSIVGGSAAREREQTQRGDPRRAAMVSAGSGVAVRDACNPTRWNGQPRRACSRSADADGPPELMGAPGAPGTAPQQPSNPGNPANPSSGVRARVRRPSAC